MTTIYLVRHGETDNNRKHIIQGATVNSHLNQNGVNKTKELRQTILELGVDVCYTSPLIRTVETAFGLVGDKVMIYHDDRIIERNLGNFENKPLEEYKNYREKYWDYNLNFSEFNVEPIKDLFKRCKIFLDDIIEKNKGKKILVVSHQAPIRAMHHILRKTDLTHDNLMIKMPNCSLEVIEIK